MRWASDKLAGSEKARAQVFPGSAGRENDRRVWMSFGPFDQETVPIVVARKGVLGASCLMFMARVGR